MSPYEGMVQRQDGRSNGCISKYTTITWLEASVTPSLHLSDHNVSLLVYLGLKPVVKETIDQSVA